MARSVLRIGTLDTKGEELRFLKECLTAAGAAVEVVDVSVLGEPLFAAEVQREEIARAAGESIEELRAAADRGRAVAAMQLGVSRWMRSRHEREPVGGVLAIGGSAVTTVATAPMRGPPVGVPKLMVSTMASGNTRAYVGITDVTMMYSVADFTGLNRLIRTILANAAHAM